MQENSIREARAFLGRYEYKEGNIEATLPVFDASCRSLTVTLMMAEGNTVYLDFMKLDAYFTSFYFLGKSRPVTTLCSIFCDSYVTSI